MRRITCRSKACSMRYRGWSGVERGLTIGYRTLSFAFDADLEIVVARASPDEWGSAFPTRERALRLLIASPSAHTSPKPQAPRAGPAPPGTRRAASERAHPPIIGVPGAHGGGRCDRGCAQVRR